MGGKWGLNEIHLLCSGPNQHRTRLGHLLSEGASAVNGMWAHLKQQGLQNFLSVVHQSTRASLGFCHLQSPKRRGGKAGSGA